MVAHFWILACSFSAFQREKVINTLGIKWVNTVVNQLVWSCLHHMILIQGTSYIYFFIGCFG